MSDPAAPTLVTAATGARGNADAHALPAQRRKVHVSVRNPDAPAARALTVACLGLEAGTTSIYIKNLFSPPLIGASAEGP